MKKNNRAHGKRPKLKRRALGLLLALAMVLSSLPLSAFAYDAYANPKKNIQLERNGRTVTYADLYGGQTTNRPDTSDETQFYLDAVKNQDTLLHWANLGYTIHESLDKSYWDHAGNGWDDDFGSGHYIDYISDMLTARSKSGDGGMKSTGVCIANSLADVQSRATNDIANLIDRKVSGNDFLKRHKMSDLTDTKQPVVYSTVSNIDRYGKTPQYGYNSFTIAFYDFRLNVLDDGDKLNTSTGDKTLAEAVSSSSPGFSYSTNTADSGIISPNQNNSYDDAAVTVSLAENTSETTSSSITNSTDYTFGQKIGGEMSFKAKVPLIAEADFKIVPEISFGQTIGTAYSSEDSITKSEDKSSSVTMNLPAHTVATANQSTSTAKMTTSYDCPVGVTYKVAIFSMCGTMYDDNALVQSFSTAGYEQRSFITTFGGTENDSDAVESLYQRATKNANNSSYEETYGNTKGTNDDDDTWCTKLNWSNVLNENNPTCSNSSLNAKLKSGNTMVNAMNALYPMSITGASTSMYQSGISTTLGTPTPMYPIKYVYVNYQLNRTFNMNLNDTLPIHSYRVKAYDKDMVPYYGFVAGDGTWKIVDSNGNPTSSSVARIDSDPVTHEQTIIATGTGTVYAKYYIPENTYTTYDGVVSTNASLKSPAYKIVVSEPSTDPFTGTIKLSGSVNATVNDEAINLNALDTLTATAYDSTGKQVAVPLTWEAQELESAGIKVTSDGALTVTKTGTYHVRACCDSAYSNWVEVHAKKQNNLILSTAPLSSTQPVTAKNAMKCKDFVQMLRTLTGSTGVQSTEKSTDSSYKTILNWAKNHSILTRLFRQNDRLTRQKMAEYLYNAAKSYGLNPKMKTSQVNAILSKYKDSWKISPKYRVMVAYAIQHGYLTSTNKGKIDPNGYVNPVHGITVLTALTSKIGVKHLK